MVRPITSLLLIWLAAVLALAAALAGAASHASAEPDGAYVAVVVGAGRHAAALAIPEAVKDAEAMARRLRARGFRLVTTKGAPGCGEGPLLDPDLAELRAALECFKAASRSAAQALLYFSGHSFELEGRDFLVAAGADAELTAGKAVDLQSTLADLEQANPGVLIAVIDGSRRALRTALRAAHGNSRPASTMRRRLVASSAAAGAWAAAPATPSRRNAAGVEPETAGLSPFTAKLIAALDDDLDARLEDLPAAGAALLLAMSTSLVGGETTIDNAASIGMLGHMPKLGTGMCEVVDWRAANIGRCLELTAAYVNCGRSDVWQRALQERCTSDWQEIARDGVRGMIAKAMRQKSCSTLNELVRNLDATPEARGLPELSEISSMARYTCAIEAKEKLKSGAAALLAGKDCAAVQSVLLEHGDVIEPDIRSKLRAHAKSICCPEYGLGKECVSRSVFAARLVAKLEERGCPLGTSKEQKAVRSFALLDEINARTKVVLDVAGNGSLMDQLFTTIDKMDKTACTCRDGETVSKTGLCTCSQYNSTVSKLCLDRAAAIRQIAAGLNAAGCAIRSDGETGLDALRPKLLRLKAIDPTVKDAELTPQSYPAIEAAAFAKDKSTLASVCAELTLDPKLAPDQRNAVESTIADLAEKPFAAVAVASSCPSSRCEWASASREKDADTAVAKAMEACRRKVSADCMLGASHRVGGGN